MNNDFYVPLIILMLYFVDLYMHLIQLTHLK